MKLPKIIFLFALAIAGAASYFIFQKKNSSAIHSEKSPRESDALEALQFLTASRAFPSNDIPPDAYQKAYSFYRKNFSSVEKNSTGNWKSIGPNNVGGRTLCIALDPVDTGIVWLGSASGGLWKSTVGGIGQNAWTYVPTGFPVLGVSSIAINPNNNKEMFIGTGETYAYGNSTNGLIDRTTRGTFGIGILKSTDGGNTWSQSLNWNYQQNRGVWEILFNPKDTNMLYAATTEGVYKTIDGGANWTQSLAVSMAMDLVIDKVDTNIVYAGVGNLSSANKGLYKTTNGGITWNILTNGLPANTQDGRIIISAYENNSKTLLAMVNNAFNTVGIYRSTDAGQSWTPVVGQTDIAQWQGWYSKCLLMMRGDSNLVISGGVDLFKSVSLGDNFFQISDMNGNFGSIVHSDIHDIVANPKNPFKVYVATDGGLYRSDDFGDSFYWCADGYVTSQFYIGSVSSTDSTIGLGGLQDNFTQRYNGTPYWDAVLGGDGCYNAINPQNDFTQYAAYQYLNILQSSDQGNSFNNQVLTSPSGSNGGNPAAFLAPYLLCPSNPDVLYAGGDSLLRSDNGALSWTVVSPVPLDSGNIILSIAVSYTNPDTVYCATAPSQNFPMHIFRSIDGGFTFTNITGNNLPNRYPRRITVSPDDSKKIYVVFSGFGSGHIFKSLDAGNSWTNISDSLPDVPFHCLAVDPFFPDTIFAGCDLGIFSSENGGTTWSAYNTGMPEAVMVFDLVYSPSDEMLLAYTHGHGVFKRTLHEQGSVNAIQSATGNRQSAISIYPNPAATTTNLKFSLEKEGLVSFQIYNSDGKKIFEKNQMCRAGNNFLPLSVSDFEPGVYFVVMTSQGQTQSKKLVVMK